MQNVTNELTQFERGQLFFTCRLGIMIGGQCGSNGRKFLRRYILDTMKNEREEEFVRTGEILKDDNDNFLIEFKAI